MFIEEVEWSKYEAKCHPFFHKQYGELGNKNLINQNT